MIKRLDWSHDNILAYEASGKMTNSEHKQAFSEIGEAIAKYGKVRLFVRLPEMAFPEFSAMCDRLKFAKKHIKDIERYALVSNITFIDWLSKIADMSSGIDFKSFRLYEENQAKEWLESSHITHKKGKPIIAVTSVTVALLLTLFAIKSVIKRK